MPEFKHYVLRLHPTRAEMPFNPTEFESRVMSQHFEYLKRLLVQGKVLLAGPVFGNPVYGLCVIKGNEAEARAIGEHDPSVLAGINTFDLEPLVLSLMCKAAAE